MPWEFLLEGTNSKIPENIKVKPYKLGFIGCFNKISTKACGQINAEMILQMKNQPSSVCRPELYRKPIRIWMMWRDHVKEMFKVPFSAPKVQNIIKDWNLIIHYW